MAAHIDQPGTISTRHNNDLRALVDLAKRFMAGVDDHASRMAQMTLDGDMDAKYGVSPADATDMNSLLQSLKGENDASSPFLHQFVERLG